MFTLKKHGILILIAILSTLFVKGSQACRTGNSTSKVIRLFKAGDNFFQPCDCEHPVLTTKNLHWLDNNNKEIKGPGNGSKVYTEQGHRILNLYIDDLNKSHSGSYKCVSKEDDGKVYVQEHFIEVYEPLYFLLTNTTQYLTRGQDSFIACNAKGHDKPFISWAKGQDETMLPQNAKYLVKPGGLVIKNASNEDAGKYFCTASVPITGERETKPIDVEVYTAPVVADIIAIPGESIVAGENVTLDCKAGGYPLPTYVWKKINQTENETITWNQDLNKITFINIRMQDQGTYECEAYNGAGNASKNISIEVLAVPTIEGFGNVTENEGNLVSIVCKGIGRPAPDINISYYGVKSDSSPGYTITSDNSTYTLLNLTFEKLEIEHEGWYDCNASNTVGSDQKTMHLRVNHKPYFEVTEEVVWAWDDKVVNLSCEHTSQPAAEIKWNYIGDKKYTAEQMQVISFWTSKTSKIKDKNFTFSTIKDMLYGIYECTAKNELGEAKKVMKVQKGFKPPAVETINIVETAASSATFNIKAPYFVGPKIIGFHAEYDEVENYEITNIHFNRTWAANNVLFKIEHLKPMRNYSVRFAAQNEVGIGPFGRAYIFETPEKSTPEPPSWDYNSEPVLISSDNNTLRLKPPEHNGDPIDYIIVKYCPIDELTECIEQKVDPTTELKVPELDQNVTYSVEMIAHNSVGNSTPNRLQIRMNTGDPNKDTTLSAGAIIGIAVVLVIIAILLLDLLLFCTKKQGMVANCYHKKNKKKKTESLQSKDKKGLLKDNGEASDTLKRADNGHKEFEYNKTTGIITGKHSAV